MSLKGVPNQFFGAELECYAYYKSLRDYRLVEDTTHCPPWCMTVAVTGHTFQANNETFLPRYNLDADHLVFPAVNANDATYRSLLLSNTGTTPILYDFQKDTAGWILICCTYSSYFSHQLCLCSFRIYTMKPTSGLLPPGQHQVFIVKCLPKEVTMYKHKITLCMNDMEKNAREITMIGSAESPEVLLDNGGQMYFKPTCVGTSSTRKYAVKNISRIPLCFEWKFKHVDAKLLSVEPSSGMIQPNESQVGIETV